MVHGYPGSGGGAGWGSSELSRGITCQWSSAVTDLIADLFMDAFASLFHFSLLLGLLRGNPI